MAWCHQATSHYLNQCWQRSTTPYGVTRPQWVKVHCKFRYTTRWQWDSDIHTGATNQCHDWCLGSNLGIPSFLRCQCQGWPSSVMPNGITKPQWDDLCEYQKHKYCIVISGLNALTVPGCFPNLIIALFVVIFIACMWFTDRQWLFASYRTGSIMSNTNS